MVDELRFDGQVIVVTGGGRGIGREHALLLGARGATVVVNDAGVELDGRGADSDPATSVAAEIVAAGGRAAADTHDISTPDGGAAVIEEAIERFGRVDGLVHNAGAGADAESLLRIHLRGAFHVLAPLWPRLCEQKYGRIVLTTSNAGLFGWGFDSPAPVEASAYPAAKMGLVGMMHDLANSGRQHNILVNAVAPAAATRMSALFPGSDAFNTWLRDEFPVDQVSPVVACLLHESSETTHQIFTVGGGRVARVFLGETVGFTRKAGLTVEDVSRQMPVIMGTDGFRIFENPGEEMDLFAEQLGVGWRDAPA